jgi:hypothetical protein
MIDELAADEIHRLNAKLHHAKAFFVEPGRDSWPCG